MRWVFLTCCLQSPGTLSNELSSSARSYDVDLPLGEISQAVLEENRLNNHKDPFERDMQLVGKEEEGRRENKKELLWWNVESVP